MANLAADGQAGERRLWLKHTSSYFRLLGGFSGAVALGSTVTLMVRMGGVQKFSICMCEFYQNLISDAAFLLREEKSRSQYPVFFFEAAQCQ